MLFVNLLTMAAMAGIVAITWLPTASADVLIGYCQQTIDHHCPQTSANATGSGSGPNVLPYNNCVAWRPEIFVKSVCIDVQCQNCTAVNEGVGRCIFYKKPADAPIRCVIL